MNERGIINMLRALGVPSSSIVSSGRGWVNCPCPLATWTHTRGLDERPSFGVSIDEEHVSVYYCFGCMTEARIFGALLGMIFVHSGAYPWEAAAIYARHECEHTPRKPRTPSPWKDPSEGEQSPNPLPPRALERFPVLQRSRGTGADRIRLWIEQERQIPEWVQNLYRLRYDGRRRSVVFPLTDKNGRIFVLRERRLETKNIWTVTPKIAGCPELTFPKIRETGVWFGMHLANWSDPVMLVEGEFDAMRVASLGWHNVIASATSSVADAQIDQLYGQKYILGYDSDKGGEHAVRRIKDRLGDRATLQVAKWSRVGRKDGGALKNEEELREVLGSLEKT